LSGHVFSLYCEPATSKTKPDEKVLWVRLQGDMRQNKKNCLIVFLSIHTHRHATTWTVHLFYVFFFFFLVETLAATGISRSLMIEGSENLVKCEERQKHNQNNFFFYEPMLRFLFIFK
jgi:hypothetical protein